MRKGVVPIEADTSALVAPTLAVKFILKLKPESREPPLMLIMRFAVPEVMKVLLLPAPLRVTPAGMVTCELHVAEPAFTQMIWPEEAFERALLTEAKSGATVVVQLPSAAARVCTTNEHASTISKTDVKLQICLLMLASNFAA